MIKLIIHEQQEKELVSVNFCNGGASMKTLMSIDGETDIEINAIIQELSTLHDVIERLTAYKLYKKLGDKYK
jgi:hypothetical protein